MATLLAAGGCGPEAEKPPGATSPGSAAAPQSAPAPAAAAAPAAGGAEAARAEARQLFDSRCVTCHGPQGAGDGPASAGLTPPPRNLRDPVWQQSVTDTHIEQIVQYGGAAVGKSPAMPSNPDLGGKPEVVAALRAHIRSLAK
jgi:mono/diheme cytochrome c family protein